MPRLRCTLILLVSHRMLEFTTSLLINMSMFVLVKNGTDFHPAFFYQMRGNFYIPVIEFCIE